MKQWGRWRKRAFVFCVRKIQRFRRSRAKTGSTLPIISVEMLGKDLSPITKTAALIALAEALAEHGFVPHVWTRGANYWQTRLLQNPDAPSGLTEDAFILSQSIPTWVSRQPDQALRAAEDAGATILLLNGPPSKNAVVPHFSIALVSDPSSKAPLPWYTMSHIDAVVTPRFPDKPLESPPDLTKRGAPPLYFSFWSLEAENVSENTPLIGFTGLLNSGVFYQMLLISHYNVKGFIPLSSSNSHKETQWNALVKMVQAQNALLATSQQDYFFLPKKIKLKVHPFSLRLSVDKILVQKILEACSGTQPDSAHEVTSSEISSLRA
ncbi:hypothetical protein AGMMS49949_04970 [Alphaproteobacteria bacterium]|nr:hypothetical protein AGMMS49949_04970 [Alphaproteobacteria bacterium]GHS97265.1 hypothetical protein AGMMS50296_4120 [Alphaproteobacteria bacterium]